MKNGDYIKAQEDFLGSLVVSGEASYIFIAEKLGPDCGDDIIANSSFGKAAKIRELLMLFANTHPELKSCFSVGFLKEASHAPVRFGGDGGIRVAQSPISRWQRTLPFNFKRYLCNKEQQE